jgi:hypothetical protein
MLAKAQSTEFPAEAEALMAKAQELMARHAIDEAMLQASGSGRGSDAVGSQVIVVEPPYAGAKAALLGSVARANHCRLVIQGGGQGARTCVLVGHESDLAGVTTLFTALSLHATRTMLATPVPAHDGPRRFRHAFLHAFAARIGERLREATRQAEAEAGQGSPAQSVELVLRDRSDAVDRALAEQFPNLRTMRTQVSSVAGISSGRAAADTAALGQRGVEGSRGALGR